MLLLRFVRNHFADPDWENEIPNLYLDSQDKVTVGIGCQIFSVKEAEALHFVYRDDQVKGEGKQKEIVARKGDTATAKAIDHDYNEVLKKAGADWAATSFKKVTLLDLPTDEVDRLFYERVATFEGDLRDIFSDYDHFPAPGELALMDMIFNLGTSGLVKKFPALVEAAKKRDWSTAAKECHRLGIPERRNTRTAELFGEAADDEAARQKLKDAVGKIMPRNVFTQPHAWEDPVFEFLDVIKEMRDLKVAPRAQGKR
jgi:hypothetical protein